MTFGSRRVARRKRHGPPGLRPGEGTWGGSREYATLVTDCMRNPHARHYPGVRSDGQDRTAGQRFGPPVQSASTPRDPSMSRLLPLAILLAFVSGPASGQGKEAVAAGYTKYEYRIP